MSLPDALQTVQTAVINLCVLILTLCIPILINKYGSDLKDWLGAKAAEVEAKMDDRQKALIQEGIRIAVQAAEQAGLAGLIQDKKKYALDYGEKWLAEHGVFGLDLHYLDGLVESTVYELFGWEKKGKEAVPEVVAQRDALAKELEGFRYEERVSSALRNRALERVTERIKEKESAKVTPDVSEAKPE